MTTGAAGARAPLWRTALRLGRVSNLPTVWSGAVAGAALGGGLGAASAGRLGLAALACSLAYVAGMWLNDAFDREIDARERPERPIPAGDVSAAAVFAGGAALLAAALVLLGGVSAAVGSPAPVICGAALAAAIVLYDWAHKGVRIAPAVMGLCRALVYATSAAAVGGGLAGAPAGSGPWWGLPPLLWGAVLLAGYVLGLTAAAAQENRLRLRRAAPLALLAAPAALALGALPEPGGPAWAALAAYAGWTALALWRLLRPTPDLRAGISGLIAGISLLDALWVALCGAPAGWVLLCAAGAPLTRLFQRTIPGT